jgi:signal peptide peptidase-like protein 2B
MIAKIPTECSQDSKCSSGHCVLTNTTNENGTLACCAWDLYMTMGASSDESVQPSIPAVFVRMTDVDTLSSLPELDSLTLDVSIYQRSTPLIDFSSVLIWMIAVCTVAIGSSRAAEDDKITTLLTKDGMGSRRSSISEANQRIQPAQVPLSTASIVEPRSGFIPSRSNSMDSRDFESVKGEHNPNSLDITPLHAVAFVFVSSGFLLLLYFVDLYFFVTIMYLGSAALATNIIIFYPAIKRLGRKIHGWIFGVKSETYSEYMSLGQAQFDLPFIVGQILSTGLSVLWYFYKDSNWVWLVQDFMGVSVCIMFLAAIRLPNLKVATILLGLAFFYDIFFVFISPYIFNSSVMVDVATGPTTSHDDENYCEKYPTDESCETTQLPMLLVVPTFSSYESSESMLGLGDVVLPGLLLVWCARLDMRRYGSLSSESASKGYLPMALLGYALGLLVANLAVDYFKAGQPALLYIVPLTLGPVLYRSHNSGSLRDLWRSLPALKLFALPVDVDEMKLYYKGLML